MKKLRFAILVALALTVPGGRARAQDEEAEPKHVEMMGSAEEKDAWKAVEEGKFIRARNLGEALVAAHPDSFAGQFVLGVAFHRGESDLARAVRHLEMARKLYKQKFPLKPAPTDPWRWNVSTLNELAYAYQEMERFEPMLEIIDELDENYRPVQPARHVWPLVKLHRFDEARNYVQLALKTSDEQGRRYALANLCSVESESGTREATYKACLAVTTAPEVKGQPNMVELSNAAEAASGMLKFDEAEQLWIRSTKAKQASIATPYQRLASLYMAEGRVAEAVSAMRGAREQQVLSDPWLDQQKVGQLDGTLADLLMIAGEGDRAAQIAERAVVNPDRHGLWSGTPEQAWAAESIRYAAALTMRAEQEEEEAVVSGFFDSIKLRGRAAMDRIEAWRQRRHAGSMFSVEKFLIRSFTPSASGGVNLPGWLAFDVVGAIGGGVSLEAAKRARVEAAGFGEGYLQAIEAEAWLASGDTKRAEEMADLGIKNMPQAEVMMKTRLHAIAAIAARRRGDLAAETARLSQVLAHDPSLLRRMGIEIPVTIKSDGSEVAEKAKSMVASSPRFRKGSAAFVVTLSGSGEACLLGPSGERINCGRPQLPDGSATDRARVVVRELHKTAFALNVSLTQSDLNSLDGSPATARAAHQVDELLGGMKP